jgi:hypothetical protein
VWDVTRELLERLTVEARVVDVDVEEMDTIEAQDIDVEGIQQSIIEGDLFEGDATIESRHVDSEFAGDDVVHTYLHRWTTVEDEVVDRKLLVADVTDVENYEMEVAESLPVETRYTEEDTIAAMSEGTTAEATPGEPMAEGTTGEPMAEETTGEPMAEVTSGEPAAQAPTITQDDEGKDVVDAAGEKIGMIDEVEASTAYVDPNPSLTDRIKAALDWGDVDEGDYPLPAEQISEITDDEVRLREGPDLGT